MGPLFKIGSNILSKLHDIVLLKNTHVKKINQSKDTFDTRETDEQTSFKFKGLNLSKHKMDIFNKHMLFVSKLYTYEGHDYFGIGVITSKDKSIITDKGTMIKILKLGEYSNTGFQGCAKVVCLTRIPAGKFNEYFCDLSESDIKKYGGIKNIESMKEIYCDSLNQGDHLKYEIFDLFEPYPILSIEDLNKDEE